LLAVALITNHRRHQRLGLVLELLVQLRHLGVHHIERNSHDLSLQGGIALAQFSELLIRLGALQVKRQHQILLAWNRQRHALVVGEDEHRDHIQFFDRVSLRNGQRGLGGDETGGEQTDSGNASRRQGRHPATAD